MHSTLTVSFSWFNYGTLGKSTTPYLIEIKVVWWEFIMLNWMSVVDFTKPFSECIICIGLTWQKMKRDVVWIQIYLNDWNITEVYTWQGSKMMYIGNETNEGGLGWKARGVQATRASLLKYICLWSFPPFIHPPPSPHLLCSTRVAMLPCVSRKFNAKPDDAFPIPSLCCPESCCVAAPSRHNPWINRLPSARSMFLSLLSIYLQLSFTRFLPTVGLLELT